MTPTGTTSTTSHPCPKCGGTVICHCETVRPPMVVEAFTGNPDEFLDWLMED